MTTLFFGSGTGLSYLWLVPPENGGGWRSSSSVLVTREICRIHGETSSVVVSQFLLVSSQSRDGRVVSSRACLPWPRVCILWHVPVLSRPCRRHVDLSDVGTSWSSCPTKPSPGIQIGGGRWGRVLESNKSTWRHSTPDPFDVPVVSQTSGEPVLFRFTKRLLLDNHTSRSTRPPYPCLEVEVRIEITPGKTTLLVQTQTDVTQIKLVRFGECPTLR